MQNPCSIIEPENTTGTLPAWLFQLLILPYSMNIPYYLHENGEKSGPYSYMELINKPITPDTLLWYEGLYEWTKAGELLEFIDFFSGTPVNNTVVMDNNE